MYTYSIFCVKAKVGSHYFYKTEILYRFLKEFRENRSRNYLQLQYEYITEPLTLDIITTYIQLYTSEVVMEKRDKHLKLYWKDKNLTIYEDDQHVEFTCDSIEDAEYFLFPALRKLKLYFFVTGHHVKHDYGWLSFIKKNKTINKQILYSFH